MKVMYGYGFCRFRIAYVSNAGVWGWENIDLRINNNTFPVDKEIGHNFVNIYANENRNITHIKRSFTIELLRNDSNQTDLINLVAKLHRNPRDWFYFYLHCPQGNIGYEFGNWYGFGNELCRYKCTTDVEKLSNLVSGYHGNGQILEITVKVKDKISVTDNKYIYIPYRDTETGLWDCYPDPPSRQFAIKEPVIGIISI